MHRVKRPILRYHGGKWRFAPWIISHFKEHRVYVEPFGGAASVLLRKERAYAEVYNDLDGALVNLFKQVRDNGPELIRRLSLTPYSRSEFKDSYIESDDPVEQARRTVVGSLMGFGSNSLSKNTGFRSNSNRSSTTPAHDFANYPEKLMAIIERLRGVVIECRDFESIMLSHDSEQTLHYLDPPYLKSTRGPGNDYNHEMTDDDHVRMLHVAKSMHGMVIISGYDNGIYNNSLASWCKHIKPCFADGARPRTECIWINR